VAFLKSVEKIWTDLFNENCLQLKNCDKNVFLKTECFSVKILPEADKTIESRYDKLLLWQ